MAKPNVLFLIVDQWNYRCLGHAGHPVVRTPALDRLRAESVSFGRTYVQNAFCLPSRISYLTGQYLCTHRQYGFHGLMPEGIPSMPAFFRENGYDTFHVGKAHVNPMVDQLGFDTYIPTLPEDICFAPDMDKNYQAYCRRKGYPYPHDQVHGGDRLPPFERKVIPDGRGSLGTTGPSNIPAEDSIEAYTADRAVEFIEAGHDRPFFMHVSFDRPHPPLTPSEPWSDAYAAADIPVPEPYTEEQLARLPAHIRRYVEESWDGLSSVGRQGMQQLLVHYYALMSHIDHEIGRVLQALRDQGLYEDTIVVFCTDHGDMAGYKGLFNKYSNTIYHDDIIRTPLLIKWPRQTGAGEERTLLAEAIDVFPTLAGICELDASALPLDGTDLSAPRARKQVAFSESYAIKTLIKNHWKLIYYVNRDEGELYDLQADPDERVNLYAEPEHAARITDLKLEIGRKMTPTVSEQRKQFIRALFDDGAGDRIGAMAKLYKWDKAIADGGGFWLVARAPYRLACIPFDRELRLEKAVPEQAEANRSHGWARCDEEDVRSELLDELLDYLATKIRPVSLMTGGEEGRWKMLHTDGSALV